MSLRDYYRCKKCDAKVVYGPDRSDEDWEPFLLCRQCIAQLERTNAALLGALKRLATEMDYVHNLVRSSEGIEALKQARTATAIAEAETTGGPNHETQS